MTNYKCYYFLISFFFVSVCCAQQKLLYLGGASNNKSPISVYDPDIIYQDGFRILPKYDLKIGVDETGKRVVYSSNELVFSQKEASFNHEEGHFLELLDDDFMVITIYNKIQNFSQPDLIDRKRCYIMDLKNPQFVYELHLNGRRLWVSQSMLNKSFSKKLHAFKEVDLKTGYVYLINKEGIEEKLFLNRIKNTFR